MVLVAITTHTAVSTQYFKGRPLFSITSCSLLSIDPIMFLMLPMSIVCQILSNSSLKWAKLLISILFILPEAKAHKFSMGLRSGLFPGHVITFTPLLLNTLVAIALVWGVALSYWKEYAVAFPLNTALVAGRNFSYSNPLYSTAPMPLHNLPLADLNY